MLDTFGHFVGWLIVEQNLSAKSRTMRDLAEERRISRILPRQRCETDLYLKLRKSVPIGAVEFGFGNQLHQSAILIH